MKKTFLFLTLTSTMLLAQQEAIIYGLSDSSSFLSLRDKAVTGKKVGKLYNDNKVTILATEGKWYKIQLSTSKQIGWAHGDWVKKLPQKEKASKKQVTKKQVVQQKVKANKAQNHTNIRLKHP